MTSSCQKKMDYAQIIEQRAKTNIELSYAGIRIGDSFAKYSSDKNVLTDVKSENFHCLMFHCLMVWYYWRQRYVKNFC